MPHHSAQKRQMNTFASSAPPQMMPGSSSFPPRPFPPARTSSLELDYRMVSHQGVVVPPPHHHQHPSMRPHPPVSMTSSWTTTSSGTGGGVIHRVDLHTEENARSGPTVPSRGTSEDATSTPRLLPHEASRSFDSPHEVAASVLLLAATAMKERDGPLMQTSTNTENNSTTVPTTSDEPDPKKRKQAAEIMRKKSTDTLASHVSPYSHSSNNKNPANSCGAGASTTEATTPLTDRCGGTGSSPTSSYDLKDGQALHDSAKITDTKEISPPSHVEIPHFPSLLHAVLTESEFAGKVLMWLPHGQAWKIVRWDALRKQVLPKYFSQLREEDSKEASGSIDAFLWHLSAWGFEEVNDGPDVGAYSHVLFRRELPGLCREMRFSPSETGAGDSADKDRGGGARYILQVPSLASTGVASEQSGRSALDEEKKEDYPGSAHPNQVTPAWPKRQQVSVGYHSETQPSSTAWKYYTETSHWVSGGAASPSSVQSQRAMPPYSPIRVRSGRGACRLPLNRSRMLQDATEQQQQHTHRSFPVSNRGKGGRAAPRRVSHPPSSEASVTSSTAATEVIKGGGSGIGAPPPRPILKRKLPMVRKSSSSSSDDDSSSNAPNDDRTSPVEEEEKKEEEV